jgi:hypothetical protein
MYKHPTHTHAHTQACKLTYRAMLDKNVSARLFLSLLFRAGFARHVMSSRDGIMLMTGVDLCREGCCWYVCLCVCVRVCVRVQAARPIQTDLDLRPFLRPMNENDEVARCAL